MNKLAWLKNIQSYVKRFNVSDDVAFFIACQFALESNWGTSPLAINYSNYCGMRCPLVRPTLALNYEDAPIGVFARYGGLYDCVEDYMLCISFHKPMRKELEDVNLFSSFLKFYCPEKSYIKSVYSIYNQFINQLKS